LFSHKMNTFPNNSNIVIKYHSKLDSLPKPNLIAYVPIGGVFFGFYTVNNTNDDSFLFVGKSLDVPTETFRLLSQYSQLPSKISSYHKKKKCSTAAKCIKNYFKTTEEKFKGNCVFHVDKNPSMHVDLNRGIFHCFACNSSGTITKLVSKIRASECWQTK